MLDGERIFGKVDQAEGSLATVRSGIAGVLYRDFIIVAGSECLGNGTHPELEPFALKTGRWVSLAPMLVGRHSFGDVVVGNALYFVAGDIECGGGGRSTEFLVVSLP
jgi:hypothetical protein